MSYTAIQPSGDWRSENEKMFANSTFSILAIKRFNAGGDKAFPHALTPCLAFPPCFLYTCHLEKVNKKILSDSFGCMEQDGPQQTGRVRNVDGCFTPCPSC